MISLSRITSNKIKKLKTRMSKSTLKTVNSSCSSYLILIKCGKLRIRIEFKTKIHVFIKLMLTKKSKWSCCLESKSVN